jgi:hypothetical protein
MKGLQKFAAQTPVRRWLMKKDWIKALLIYSLVLPGISVFQIACLTRNYSKRKFQHLQNRKEKRMNKKAILIKGV